MKRQIIVRIVVCMIAITLFCAGVFALNACNKKTGDDGATYELNLSNYDGIAVYGEPMDLSRITLTRTEGDLVTEIPVDTSMITTHVDTTKVGAKLLKLNYAGNNFQVPVIVKYKVQFRVDGTEIQTFYVLNAAELEEVTVAQKPGYVFSGWSEEIPEIITDNMTFDAVYTPEIPVVSDVLATYGDALSGIQLPATAVGAWQFDNAEGTVGDAGNNQFPISFISYETGEALATGTVTVHVAKKEVTFFDVVDSFTYNGLMQLPTYQTDVPVNVIFYEDAEANYTDAGVYAYYFEVDEPNYKGTLVGTYEIKPAYVTVQIGSYTILADEELPVVEYQVLGFENVALLGLSITNPEEVVTGVGVYTLTATTNNKNVVLTVEEGTLTVNTTTFDVADPTVSKTIATYGDLISSITFSNHPNGKWTWKNPDALVGVVGEPQAHIAVFTPTDSRYEPVEKTVYITVTKKVLTIEIVGSLTFDYDSAFEHSVSYIVTDANGTVYENFVVEGNQVCKNAGEYNITLVLNDANYTATKQVTLIINKINPTPNFDQVFDLTWERDLTLSKITLPTGYELVDPATKDIASIGTHTFSVVYIPDDTTNYNTVYGEFTVNVGKASASISNVDGNYTFTYNGSAFTLDAVQRSHTESALEFIYQKDGVTVSSITNAGVYTVTIMLSESEHYLAAEIVTTTVTVQKANNNEIVTLSHNATYGDLVLGRVTLPAGIEGTWAIQGVDAATLVGDAGTKTLTFVYTSTTGNYNDREVEVTLTVAQKRVSIPAILSNYREQVFNGTTLTAGLSAAEGYIITDNGGVNVGTYTAIAKLVSENYLWSDGTGADKTLTYQIIAADNQWITSPTIGSWVYGEAGNAVVAEALAGTILVEYKALEADDSDYSTTIPTAAGKYVARFTAVDSNYKNLVATCEFTIEKKAVTVPEISASKLEQIYTGSALNSGLTDTDEYTVIDNGKASVGTYTATLVLNDKNNYKWATTDASDNIQLNYTVVQAQIVISDFAINGWTYGAQASAPTATTNFGTVSYVYATDINGEYTATVPTEAGTYYVKAIAKGNENLIGAESEAISFTIAKASVSINGANDLYSKVYDAKEYTVSGVTASNGATLSVVITKNGETVDRILDAGEYTVTFSVAESANYLSAEKSVTVLVTAATNTEIVNTNQSAIYGDAISVIVLPAGVQGTWSIKDATTVGNAGINTFTAVFTPANGNYNSREVEITVTVAKAVVKAPIVQNKEFDEQYHNSGLTSTGDYTVTEDIGGINHGIYQVVLTLNDPANYKWANSEEASIVINYQISVAINKWVEEPDIGSWEYESAGDPGHATALHGNVKIEYKLVTDGDDAYSTTLPTLPGKYVARFTTLDDNYTILVREEQFEITKRKITPPTQLDTEFVYTGNTITSGIVGNEFFTVVDNGAINAQAGLVVTVTLNSEHYVWSDGVETLAREYTYSITPAQSVISDFAILGWIFGEGANAPTATTNFGTVSFVYADAINGEYTATVPTNAGTYYVKAVVQDNANWIGTESQAISFTIAKASVTISGAVGGSKVYDTNGYTVPSATASNNAALTVVITKNGVVVERIVDAGEYIVTYSFAGDDNYLAASEAITVTVTPATNTEEVNTNQSATYGDSISVIALPAGVQGTWSIQNALTVGNAGTNTLVAVFTPANGNYNSREVEITVTVAKKTVTVPTVPNPSMVYNSQVQYAGLASTNLYTVTDNGGTNVGNYIATVTLADASNYKWSTTEDAAVALTYTIIPAQNEISASIENILFGEELKITVSVLFGDYKVEYKPYGAGDEAYTATAPTAVGQYVAKFTTTDANYTVEIAERDFYINPTAVITPDISNMKQEYTYTGETITTGLVGTDSYTVTEVGGKDVGTYTVVLSLTGEGTVWYTGNAEDIVLTYKIVKMTTVKIEGIQAGWTYGAYVAPTATFSPAVMADKVVFSYSADGGATWSTTVPTNAGTYKIKAEIVETNNYNGASFVTDLTIKQVTTTITTAPSFVGGTFYQNMFAPTGEGAVTSVAGTWTFEKATLVGGTFSATTDNAQVVAKFIPNDSINYTSVTATYTVTFVAVAYLNNTTPFGTIEDAIAAANNAVQNQEVTSAEVWVYPAVDLGPIYIKSDVTIYAGVTLILPYYYNSTWTKNTIAEDGSIDLFFTGQTNYESLDGDKQGLVPAPDNRCSLKVILDAHKTITNHGTILISGQISSGSGAAQYSGFTAGYHARLILDEGAKLINGIKDGSGGTIYAAGLIRELEKDNGSEVILNTNSVLYQPYTLKDFPGGSVMYAFYDTRGTADSKHPITPFTRSILMNVSPMVRINYGGSVRAWAALWAGSQNNQTVGDIIGSELVYQNAVVVLTDKDYSYLTAKYDVDTEVCDLRIYGGARTNSLVLNVELMGMSQAVNTGDFLFAISYHYNITLAPAKEQTDTAVFKMDQRFKIMTGATLTVEEGAKLIATDLIVYEEFEDVRADGISYSYMKYPDKPAAIFTVNGEFEVNRFGGKIYTNNIGAKVTIKSATTYSSYEGGTFKDVDLIITKAKAVDQYKTITLNAVLVGTTGEFAPTTGVTWTVGELTVNPNNGSEPYTILYFYNPEGPQYPTLPTPTMDGGYTFDGWEYNGSVVKAGDAMSTTENHTLVARWKSGISIGLDADGDGVADETVSVEKGITVYTADLLGKAPAKDKVGYTFVGWYYGDTEIEENMSFLVATDHILTAKWQINTYNIKEGSHSNASVTLPKTEATYGEEITITITYTQTESLGVTVKDASGNVIASGAGTSLTFKMPASDVTITATSSKPSSTCLAAGTLITLADGSKKAVEDLRKGDLVMSLDHLTGQIVYRDVIIVVKTYSEVYYKNTFVFDDGTMLATINEHGIFDLDLNKYVNIDHSNYEQYIGHRFVSIDTDGNIGVKTLVDVTVVAEGGYKYDIVTNGTLNYVAEDTLSVTHVLVDVINSFDFGDNLMYDLEQMMIDIETYGLYTYDEWEEYCDISVFDQYNIPVMKVGISKGLYTKEYIISLINTYVLDESVQIID